MVFSSKDGVGSPAFHHHYLPLVGAWFQRLSCQIYAAWALRAGQVPQQHILGRCLCGSLFTIPNPQAKCVLVCILASLQLRIHGSLGQWSMKINDR